MIQRPVARFGGLLRRLAACRSGSSAVEMGIVMPVLTFAIVGTIYLGWLMFSVNTMVYAVQQAARCVAINAPACQAVKNGNTQIQQTQNYAVSMAMGLNVTAANFSVSEPASGCGWQVSYTYTFDFVAPFYGDFNVSFPASACYPAQPT